MSLGNTNDYGNKGNNTPFQIATAKLLGDIARNTGGSGSSTTITPGALRTTAAGTVAAGKKSVSIRNAGAANGTVLGVVIKPSETLSWASNNGSSLSAIAYDATGTEFVITTLG